MFVEPLGDCGDHGGHEAAAREADDHSIDELKLEDAGGSTRPREPDAKKHSAGQHPRRGPNRSPRAPQPNAATPSNEVEVMVEAMPARDQPVDAEIGARKTGSETLSPCPRK
jgi:hypothetical protein